MNTVKRKARYIAIKTFWFFARPLQLTYWFIVRPTTRGVKCVVQHADGTVLLVKLNYAHRLWTFPGGGVDRNETAAQAAMRELKEETGITLPSLKKIDEYFAINEYKRNTVTVYFGTTPDKTVTIDPVEISEARWCNPDSLPPDTAPSVLKIVTMLEI